MSTSEGGQEQNLIMIFRFSEEDTAVDYFGEQLLAAGYNYFGNEPMYSGITGQEFHADIYLGVVYYQRLRHMVLDKFQVRTVGPVDQLTRQPVKVPYPSLPSTIANTPDRAGRKEEAFDSERWNETRCWPMERPSFSKTG